MRALVRKVLRGCVRPLGLARSPRPGRDYWERRARQFGARSVLNLGHRDGEYQAVTEAQKRELFPHLTGLLRGDERLVVDLGCGPGRFTRDLAELTGGRAIGLDIVRAYLDMAPRDPRVEYRPMVEGTVDLPDECADVVWICLVLGGMQGSILSRTTAEAVRILRPGGLLFLVENTASTPDSEHWAFRPVAEYRAMFPSVRLEHRHDYVDLGERISVLAGRKRMSPTSSGRAQAVLIYADSLRAPSETFISGLIDCVSEMRPDLSILTHRLYGPAPIHGSTTADGGSPTADWRVTVMPRELTRWTPAWLANVAMRALADRELFEWGLRRFLARRPYDVIHAQFGQPGYYIHRALAANRRPGTRLPATRLVVNFYGWDATGLPASVPAWRRRYAELFQYSNLAVVVEGPVMKTRVAGLGCPEDKIHVVPLCLARPRAGWLETSRPEAGREPHLLGFVGRFVEKKGFTFALRALVPLLQSQPHLRVVIVGDGPERALIERLVREHGLDSRVSLKGMLPHAETLAEVGRMGALVVPSLTARNGDSEVGAPTLVAEAQIMGTPVIASDHADIPISLSDHSYMFKEGDGRSLVEAVERYLDNDGQSYDIERARQRTLERHDWREIRERYEAIYLGADRG